MAQTEAQVKALIVAKLNVIPVALPPGVYKISIGTNRLLTDPDDDKKTLTVGGAADGDNQKWLVSANGTIRSLYHLRRFAHLSSVGGSRRSPIISSGTASEWIIRVIRSDTDGHHRGTIRVNDGTKRFWRAEDNNNEQVKLSDTAADWKFEFQNGD